MSFAGWRTALAQAEDVRDDVCPLFGGQPEHRHSDMWRRKRYRQSGVRHAGRRGQLWERRRSRVGRFELLRLDGVTLGTDLSCQGKTSLTVTSLLSAPGWRQ
jgi:hypothetical protein